MFQKVEALTGLRMDKYECEADAALLLLERTTEAQQMAAMQARPGARDADVHHNRPCHHRRTCDLAYSCKR